MDVSVPLCSAVKDCTPTIVILPARHQFINVICILADNFEIATNSAVYKMTELNRA